MVSCRSRAYQSQMRRAQHAMREREEGGGREGGRERERASERARESYLSSCRGHSRPCATCTRIMVYIHNKSVPIKDNTEQSDGVQQDREPVCGPESVRVRVCVRDMTYACDACYHDVIACICTSSWHALTCVCVRTCSYESPASGCLPHTRSATCCSVAFLFPGS